MDKDPVKQTIERYEDYLPEIRQNNFQICFEYKDTGDYYVLRNSRDMGYPRDFIFDWVKFDSEGEVEEGEGIEFYSNIVPEEGEKFDEPELHGIAESMASYISDHMTSTIPKKEMDDRTPLGYISIKCILTLYFSEFFMNFVMGQGIVKDDAEETQEEVLEQ